MVQFLDDLFRTHQSYSPNSKQDRSDHLDSEKNPHPAGLKLEPTHTIIIVARLEIRLQQDVGLPGSHDKDG